jgi:hypothetical protein
MYEENLPYLLLIYTVIIVDVGPCLEIRSIWKVQENMFHDTANVWRRKEI